MLDINGRRKAVQLWYIDTGTLVRSCNRSKVRYLIDALFRRQRYVLQVHVAAAVTLSEDEAFANCEAITAQVWPELKKLLPVSDTQEGTK